MNEDTVIESQDKRFAKRLRDQACVGRSTSVCFGIVLRSLELIGMRPDQALMVYQK